MATTTQTIERTERSATKCSDCGRMLTNPGYGRNSRECCGRYRRWFSTTDIVSEVTTDDGRDAHGRFLHRATRTSREISRTVRDPGGN
jgi:hypothetical protein